MPSSWSAKDERQYKHILRSCGNHSARCKRIAAATVNKTRRRQGRALGSIEPMETRGYKDGRHSWIDVKPRFGPAMRITHTIGANTSKPPNFEGFGFWTPAFASLGAYEPGEAAGYMRRRMRKTPSGRWVSFSRPVPYPVATVDRQGRLRVRSQLVAGHWPEHHFGRRGLNGLEADLIKCRGAGPGVVWCWNTDTGRGGWSVAPTNKSKRGFVKLTEKVEEGVEGLHGLGLPPSKGWRRREPRKGTLERRKFARKHGARCFLSSTRSKTGKLDYHFPICEKNTGRVSCRGLSAAYNRARQYHHTRIAAKARRIARRHNCSWA